MFLPDPDLMADRTVKSDALAITDNSSLSSDNRKCRDDVTRRDETCMMTGTVGGVEACHIIPHAKGHQVRAISWIIVLKLIPGQYIINLVNHRLGHETFDPPLDNINDVRNR